MGFNSDVSIHQNISITPPLQSDTAPVTEHSKLEQKTNDLAPPTIQKGSRVKAKDTTKPRGLPARAMGALTKNAVTKTLFGRSNKTQAAKGPSSPPVANRGPPVAPRRGSTQMTPLAQKQLMQDRGMVVGLQLKQLKNVMAECAENPKKAPHLGKDGTLTAQIPKSSNKAQIEAGIGKAVHILEESCLLNVPPDGKGIGFKEVHQQLLSLPTVKEIDSKSNKVLNDKIASSQMTMLSSRYPTSQMSMPKESLLTTITEGKNPELSLLLINSHRSNSATQNILKDIAESAQGDEQIAHVLAFAQEYIDNGSSIPVGGSEREQISEQLKTISSLGKNSQNADLQKLGEHLEASISTHFQPAKPLDLTIKLPPANQPASPHQIREARVQLSDAKLVLDELKGFNAAVEKKTSDNEKINREIGSLKEQLGQAEEGDAKKEIEGKISSKTDEIKQNNKKIETLMNRAQVVQAKYPTLEADVNALKQALVAHNESMPKFTLKDATAQQLADQLCKSLNTSFCKIKPSEIEGRHWEMASVDKNTLSPNIQKHIEFTNNVGHFLVKEATINNNPESFSKLIDAMDICLKNNNLQAASAIRSALSQSGIERLLPSWKGVDSKHQEKKAEIENTLNMASANKGTRAKVEQALVQGKGVSFDLAIQLQDLTFIDEGNPNLVEGKDGNQEVNTSKIKLNDDTKAMMTACQRSLEKTGLPEADDTFLNSVGMMDVIHEDPGNEIYQLSRTAFSVEESKKYKAKHGIK